MRSLWWTIYNNRRGGIVWLIVILSLAISTAADKQPCTLVSREGKVDFTRKGTTGWKPTETNLTLNTGDLLRTGLRSRATLRWSELSVVRVDQLTTMEIQPPASPDGKPQLDMKSGASYFFSRERPEDIQFRTPVASGAIRGTEFVIEVGEDGRTVVTLLDGEIQVANAQGQTVLKNGEQATVNPGAAPQKTAVLDARSVIQWALYYPQVVDPDEIKLEGGEADALNDASAAYRRGNLLQAVAAYPENRQPGSDAERGFLAALQLAAGQVPQVEQTLQPLPNSPISRALREIIATVKGGSGPAAHQPATASEWLARSYSLQGSSDLRQALEAAKQSAEKSPRFGAAWIRVAELEFSFGRRAAALSALNRGLELSPENAQGHALKGFLLGAEENISGGLASFERAIAIDGALGNAWLGRGLLNIRRNRVQQGLADLQVAATVEPQRAVLRSYLGKAFSHSWDTAHARKELELSKRLDPNDPTIWLYSALLHHQNNEVNDAIRDLERSQDLNDNRSIFRSRLLLDQDQAVRSANLASIYRDAGMFDVSVQEASRAVNYDYANYSAHLFLANSYDSLRDPRLINLRYETPAFSELLVAHLLAPPNAGPLSQNVSQQEYSRFFTANHLGIFGSSTYLSSGDWIHEASQYGYFGNTAYALDGYYRTEDGQRPNNDLEQLNVSFRFKQQITPEDSIFAQVSYFDAGSGDIAQYFDQSSASTTLRVKERQEPNLLLGYHREWSPGSHTLFLAGRFDDTLILKDANPSLLFYSRFVSPFSGRTNVSISNPALFSLDYHSKLEAYTAEAQHILQSHRNTLVAGARYQTGRSDTDTHLDRAITGRVVTQDIDTDLNRLSFYAYDTFQITEPLHLTVGVSYDRLHYPENIDVSPITGAERTDYQLSPKAGILWRPFEETWLRAFYSRSLGGVFFDTSVRLEPTQIAGFNQAFRSLIPESVVGLVPGTEFETFGVGLDKNFNQTGTYIVLDGQLLKSDARRTIGILTNADLFTDPSPGAASSTRQSLDYEEKTLLFTVNQLIGRDYAVGARYRLTRADMDTASLDIDPGVSGAGILNQHVNAVLNQLTLYANYNISCGFFAQANAIYSDQRNSGYKPTNLPDEHFWHFNAFAGYRFWQRRAEARVGILNISDRDYRLNPLTLYNELARERTFVANLRIFF